MEPSRKGGRNDENLTDDLPPEIRELVQASAAARQLADEVNEEYEEVFGKSQLAVTVNESEKRISGIEETITQSKASTLEIDAKIGENWKDLERMRDKVQELKHEQKALMGSGSGSGAGAGVNCPSNPFQLFPCCSFSKWTLIGLGIGAFTTVLILVLIIVT